MLWKLAESGRQLDANVVRLAPGEPDHGPHRGAARCAGPGRRRGRHARRRHPGRGGAARRGRPGLAAARRSAQHHRRGGRTDVPDRAQQASGDADRVPPDARPE
ncbi:hypothetical protein LT493_24030 [Streptomyces tricolor]|nr:hypothetical protein [Streptomyces tricolor]